ncbi:MAG TPA: hypothetical protein PLD62_01575, partial [Candidatus Cloacimonadota bacterium]|nr:hypothetical protein [Candidatus Cloacimonadota bacterium]
MIKFYSILERPDLKPVHQETGTIVWPEFMHHDPVCNENWHYLYELFPEYQVICLDEERVVGIFNSIPLFWDGSWEELPETGWDWAIQKGIADRKQNCLPNVLCGLSIVVTKEFLGKNFGSSMIREMISVARANHLPNLILPLRPSLKSSYPQVDIEEYIRWKREDGLPFDPWLRAHVKLGGRIVRSCRQAMRLPGTIADWENWTGRIFPES